MFKLIKIGFMIIIIGLILNMLPSSLLTENKALGEQESKSIVADVKHRLSEIDYEEVKNNVINGWNNLLVIVNHMFETEEAAPVFSSVDLNSNDVTSEQETTSFNSHDFELKVLELVNVEREKHGLSPLAYSEEVSVVAREKSRDMAEKGYFAHESPTYGSPFEMMDQYGVQYWAAGENIAKGHRTPEQVMDGWMNSEGHRANILHDSFTHLGVGFYEFNGVYYWTQMFIGK